MSEREEALYLANKILERPNADPDDDLAMLSRTLLRYKEWLDKAKADLLPHTTQQATLCKLTVTRCLRCTKKP